MEDGKACLSETLRWEGSWKAEEEKAFRADSGSSEKLPRRMQFFEGTLLKPVLTKMASGY